MRKHTNDIESLRARLLTVPDACQFLRVSRSRIYELIRAGLIRPIKVGPRGTRFTQAELDHFIARCAEEGR